VSPYLISLEGIPQLLNDGLIGRDVRGGVKHKDRVEDEGISLILVVINTLGAAHNAVPRHVPKRRPSHINNAHKHTYTNPINIGLHIHVPIKASQ